MKTKRQTTINMNRYKRKGENIFEITGTKRIGVSIVVMNPYVFVNHNDLSQ